MTDDPDDPGFSLVRPYVPEMADQLPDGRRGGRVLPAHDRPTELIPVQRVERDADGGKARHRIPAPAGPMSARLRATLIIAAAVVLTGSAAGLYASLTPDSNSVTFGAGTGALPPIPTPAAVASPSGVPTPSVARTTRDAVVPTPNPAAPSPSASATTAAVVITPTTAPGAPFGSQRNLAAGKPVTGSGSTGVNVASNAVDSDPNTYWESPHWQDSWHHHPQTLMVDLGDAATIGRIVLTLPPQAVWTARTQTIKIVGSTGGWRFDTIVGTAEYRFDPATGNTVTISFDSTSVRYVELMFTANTVWPAGQLSEIEIFAA